MRDVSVARSRLAAFTARRYAPISHTLGRYGSTLYRQGGMIKTMDLRFSGAYNGAYTVDTEPLQVLNTNTNTACVQALTNIQQGAGESQRIGNKVSIKSVRVRLYTTYTGQGNGNSTFFRFMVIYDRNPNGAYVATSNILGQLTGANTVAAGVFSDDINPNQSERFVTLADEYKVLPPFEAAALNTTNYTGPTERSAFIIDRYIKCRDLECIFSATSNPGTIANSTVGSIQVLCVGNLAAGAEPWCWTGHARVRFHDA